MQNTCDVAIIGQGVMGLAANHALTRLGVDVLGFDPIEPGEARGSSQGSCRVYRRVNFESPAYKPLSEQAAVGWTRLAKAFQDDILLPCRVLEAGIPGSSIVAKSREIAGDNAGRPLRGSDINVMYPAFNLPDDWDAILHNDGGILLANRARDAFRKSLQRKIIKEAAKDVDTTGADIIITTTDGERYAAKKVIYATGPWICDQVPALKSYIKITRQVVGWFEPSEPAKVKYEGNTFPIFILDTGDRLVYGFPDFEGRGVKAAAHDHGAELRHADEAKADATDADLTDVSDILKQYIPAAFGPIRHKEVCPYTNTLDGDVEGSSKAGEFILDRLANDPRIIVASACSGHGFKFAPAIGEILSELATDETAKPRAEFRLSRFEKFR